MRENKKIMKSLAILLLLCVTFVMMYFMVFEASHEIHHCTGADCSICHELSLAENIVKQLNNAIFAICASFFLVSSIKKMESNILCSFRERTLIIDKVRIDD